MSQLNNLFANKVLFYSLFVIFGFQNAFTQTIHIQGGTTFSTFKTKRIYSGKEKEFKTENATGYAFSVGVDYKQKNHFHLSSNIGIFRRGYKETIVPLSLGDEDPNINPETFVLEMHVDYLTINTLAVYNLIEKSSFIPYVQMGPRIDFSLTDNDWLESHKLMLGILAGAGLKYDIKKFQIGLVSDYNFDFYKVFNETEENSLIANGGRLQTKKSFNTFSVQLTLAFKL